MGTATGSGRPSGGRARQGPSELGRPAARRARAFIVTVSESLCPTWPRYRRRPGHWLGFRVQQALMSNFPIPEGRLGVLDAITGNEVDLRVEWEHRRCLLVFVRHFLWSVFTSISHGRVITSLMRLQLNRFHCQEYVKKVSNVCNKSLLMLE